jgi:GNAT superfamily N-acetyltransferase
MDTTIRPATPADAAALAALRFEFRAAHAAPVEPAAAFVARCRAWMEERLAAGRWRAWVAEVDGAIHGQLWLHAIEKIPNPGVEPEAHAYISNVYVRPPLRGRGIGSRLIEAALGWCSGAAIDCVILWPSARSRALYARHGFLDHGEVMILRLAATPLNARA